MDLLIKEYYLPKKGYALWAHAYETEENLMHDLDNHVMTYFLKHIPVRQKSILDYGCGTGRYWKELLQLGPENLIGCDISPEMLSQLKTKYTEAQVILLKSPNTLLHSQSIDCIISTLVIGYFPKLAPFFTEWTRVAKSGSHLIITGIHPEMLKLGAKRNFISDGKVHNIKNYTHNFRDVRKNLTVAGWQEIEFMEQTIGKEHESYFQNKNALHIYDSYLSEKIHYGMLWRKNKP